MTFPAFAYSAPMDYVPADAIDTWLFHRGFTSWDRRREAKDQAEQGFSFKYGDTTYSIKVVRVDDEIQYAVWYAQITQSMR
jgi:hypothetical protein